MNSMKVMGRAITALALGAAITMSTAALAGADGGGRWGRDFASARVSPFDYANNGTGGGVTAVTSPSVTIQSWGTIKAVTSSSVTLLSGSGTSTTFSYTTDTTIKAIGHDSITLSSADLVVGEHAGVEFNSTASTTAVEVWVELAHVSGVVTAVTVSGNNITISDHQGFTRLILVGATTTYNNAGASGTLADVIVGAHIRAEGLVDANGTTLDALNVDICSTTNTPTPATPVGHIAPQSDPRPLGHFHHGHHRGGFGGGYGGGFGGAQGQNSRSNRF